MDNCVKRPGISRARAEKAAVTALVLAVCACLTSCILIPVSDSYHPQFEDETIRSVELYDLDAGTYGSIPEDQKPVCALSSDKFVDFCRELDDLMGFQIGFLVFPAANDPSFSLAGYVVKITYESGTYEVVGDGYQSYNPADGKFKATHHSLSTEKWNAFIEERFDYKKAPESR